jgi:hypothetical protein
MEFETDITGYGRKMGLTAGLTDEGMIDNVVRLGGGDYNGMQPAGTVPARTINPSNGQSSGGNGNAGDFAPTNGRDDGQIGNPRGGTNVA